MRCSLVATLALSITGCGSELPDIEEEVTITQGIYGQLVHGCDIPDCTETPAVDLSVFLFSSMPELDTQVFEATTTSNESGLFELSRPAGVSVLCRGYFVPDPETNRYYFGPCISVEVPEGTVRHDWSSDPAGGQWVPGTNVFPQKPS